MEFYRRVIPDLLYLSKNICSRHILKQKMKLCNTDFIINSRYLQYKTESLQ